MKILIWHFRSAPSARAGVSATADPQDSAGTDGVSLEMMKRRWMLESMGHEVAISSAYDWSDYPIPELEFDSDAVRSMMRNLFGASIVDYDGEEALLEVFNADKESLLRSFLSVLGAFEPDVIFVHNILCLPIHPAATAALAAALEKVPTPCVAIHHDILSEGAYKFTPTCDLATSLLDSFFPPRLENIMHWTINTRNQTALRQRGVEAEVIHDTIEFENLLGDEERVRVRGLLRERFEISSDDVVLMVGARIVPNKQIELACPLMRALEERRERLEGKELPSGEVFTAQSRFVLALAGRPERAFEDYRKSLEGLFDDAGIAWVYAGDAVGPVRDESGSVYALFPDVYSMADFVVYPTGWEGFGNQLIEAFAAGLPTVVFEYPVYKEDIGPKGFETISLGSSLLAGSDEKGLVGLPDDRVTAAAEDVLAVLGDTAEYARIARHNAELGSLHFGPAVLEAHLSKCLAWAGSLGGG